MSKQSKVQAKLQRALETSSIYRITRHIDAMDRIDGFIVGLGKKWVLIARTMDGGYSDGLIAVRVRDVSKLTKDRSFETEFAITQPQPTPADLATIDLDRTDQVIETLSSLASMVAVERDRVRAGSIWIGEYVGKNGKWFGLLEVRPNASWHRKPLGYRLREVTSVSINSHYLTALAVIAPEAPAGTD
ncbi:hypothetical protein [Glaciihabitans sp. UYNi722]|uniref:hypothetical protein n=1 Tax=Glaciihabitans sp. UYNi722 TaxID=3156344 RepID=UPI00339B4059